MDHRNLLRGTWKPWRFIQLVIALILTGTFVITQVSHSSEESSGQPVIQENHCKDPESVKCLQWRLERLEENRRSLLQRMTNLEQSNEALTKRANALTNRANKLSLRIKVLESEKGKPSEDDVENVDENKSDSANLWNEVERLKKRINEAGIP